MAKKKKSKTCSFKDYIAGKCSYKGGGYGLWHYGPPANLSGMHTSGGPANGSNSGNGGGNGGNGGSSNGGGNGGGAAGGMGESFEPEDVPRGLGKLKDFWREDEHEAEEEQEIPTAPAAPSAGPAAGSKKNQARALYRTLSNQQMPRKEIIAQFQQRLGLTPSSSTAYYERIAKEFGETNPQGDAAAMAGGPGGAGGMMGGPGGAGGMMGMPGGEEQMGAGGPGEEEPEKQDWESPDKQGIIRRVKGAHLVYKRQTDDGTFEEMWIYKEGDKLNDELNVRRDVLAGTDIPVEKTKSQDGRQRAEVWSVGNVQFLNITGLPN